MALSGALTLTSNDVHEVTTEKAHVLGAVGQTKDGRVYRYAKNGGSARTAGGQIQAASGAAYSSTVVGDYKVADTMLYTAGTVSNPARFEDGLVTVNGGAKLLANGAVADGTISLNDKLGVPLEDGDSVSLAANPYSGVVAQSGDNDAIGTAEVAVPANAYFWAFVSL